MFVSHRLCLGAWSDHGERTGGFYACNRYEAAKQEGVVRNIMLTFDSVSMTLSPVFSFIYLDSYIFIEPISYFCL